MNRVKLEMRKRGVMLEDDYPELPFNGIETVKVDSENAEWSVYHVSAGWSTGRMTRGGKLEWLYKEER